MNENLVSYAHAGDPTGVRFVDYASSKLPDWAVDVKPHHESKSRDIFFDLDGVFADFHGYVLKHVGCNYSDDPKAVWRELETHQNLFLNLQRIPGSLEMYRLVKGAGHNIKFLTALPQLTGNLHTARGDKTLWVETLIDHSVPVICVDHWSKKKHYATSGAILIDDMKRNIDDWTAAGGIGVIHKDPETTLLVLESLGVL